MIKVTTIILIIIPTYLFAAQLPETLTGMMMLKEGNLGIKTPLCVYSYHLVSSLCAGGRCEI